MASKFASTDLSLALGFYIPGIHHQDSVVAGFQEPGFQGYLWSFPRVDHSSVGILRWLPHANAADLRERVARFIDDRYPAQVLAKRFYAATIPCLSVESLRSQRVCGAGWALLGDAAGFADAITGEGIFYALRSAELLASAVAASLRERFFGSSHRQDSLVERAVRLAARSRTAAGAADELIAGRLGYDGFLAMLIRKSPRILMEYLIGRIS